jgi:hypothetical protein
MPILQKGETDKLEYDGVVEDRQIVPVWPNKIWPQYKDT